VGVILGLDEGDFEGLLVGEKLGLTIGDWVGCVVGNILRSTYNTYLLK
jgi:hypothetical protein